MSSLLKDIRRAAMCTKGRADYTTSRRAEGFSGYALTTIVMLGFPFLDVPQMQYFCKKWLRHGRKFTSHGRAARYDTIQYGCDIQETCDGS